MTEMAFGIEEIDEFEEGSLVLFLLPVGCQWYVICLWSQCRSHFGFEIKTFRSSFTNIQEKENKKSFNEYVSKNTVES